MPPEPQMTPKLPLQRFYDYQLILRTHNNFTMEVPASPTLHKFAYRSVKPIRSAIDWDLSLGFKFSSSRKTGFHSPLLALFAVQCRKFS